MSGAVPVGRLENRLSVPPQDFHQVVIHHEGVAYANGNLREGNLDPADEFYVRHQQIVDQCDPDLRSDGVFAGSEEALDLEILLDPLEKEFDLPAALVNRGNSRSSKIEIVGNEAIGLLRLLVQKLHQPEFARELFHRLRSRKPNDFIAEDATLFIGRAVLSENLDLSIVFDPRDEEGFRLGDLLKPVQIIVAFVEGVDAVRHDDNILLRRPDIGHFAVAQGHKARNVAGEIKFGVELDRALVLPVVRPVVLSQTQVNGRAVDRMERVVKFESVPRSSSDGAFKDFLKKSLENLR